ncbi:DUF4238 domain-containing protein [Mucilaginibacter sp. BJC16-A38]|uniref:DUF4238 domain-containing protein n=1 Tax=Mucilaginibacter phenanthrenivorans TaxID=1234842 RepID=UPI002158069C|nr:DUF4238 domain-containing protein [Mucilaginibacter phenanthrenivorans]MCR8556997.1 DUF4238 domain-containing protein [Mucilaginibacter phenanthrenivorans]
MIIFYVAKHHYLPQFYLKGFANEQGKFLIYAIANGRFKGGGKWFSPASHFFLENDNIAQTDGWADDYLEAIYSANESRYARILEKIKVVNEGFGLDNQDVVWLNYFAGELFWRVPSQREVINSATSLDQLNQLGVAVIDRRTMKQVDPDQFAAWVQADPSYFKRLRNVLPATNYWNLLDCNWPCTVKTFTDPFPAICSDSPVILRHPEKADAFLDDLIFPLTPNKVFFRIRHMRGIFAPNIKFYIDMLMVLQAREYVCCVDTEYLLHLKEAFRQNFGSEAELRKFIFDHLTL